MILNAGNWRRRFGAQVVVICGSLGGCVSQCGRAAAGEDGAPPAAAPAASGSLPSPLPTTRDPVRTADASLVLADRTLVFARVIGETTRFLVSSRGVNVRLDLAGTHDPREHLEISLANFDLGKWRGHPLIPGREGKVSSTARIAYTDSDGVLYIGVVSPRTGVEMIVDEFDAAYQRIRGRFSGTLREQGGDRTLSIDRASFASELEPPDR